MTTKKELNDKFIEYCKEFNLTIEQSRFEDGKYITAQIGTVFLTQSDPRLGKKWAIFQNTENHGISLMYDHSSPDELFGYMEGMLTMLSKASFARSPTSGCIQKVISGINWPLLREQKMHLITASDFDVIPRHLRTSLEGILVLLDNLQDAAVNDGIATEEEVCGPVDKDEEAKIIRFAEEHPYIDPVDFYNAQFQQDIAADKFSRGSYDYDIYNTGQGTTPFMLSLYLDSQAGDVETCYYYQTQEEAQHDVDMCNEMEGGILLDRVKAQ